VIIFYPGLVVLVQEVIENESLLTRGIPNSSGLRSQVLGNPQFFDPFFIRFRDNPGMS